MSIPQTFDWALHDQVKFQSYLPDVYNLQDRRRATHCLTVLETQGNFHVSLHLFE